MLTRFPPRINTFNANYVHDAAPVFGLSRVEINEAVTWTAMLLQYFLCMRAMFAAVVFLHVLLMGTKSGT